MPKTKWCDYSDLPADQCAHCRGIKAEPEDEEAGFVFRAKFAGSCQRCHGDFDAGEFIMPYLAGYAHSDLDVCL